MKKSIFLWLLLNVAVASNAQILRLSGKSYPFPTVPGSPAWQQLSSHEEMLRATEVPDSVLRSLSTADLIATAVNYPMLWDALAYDNTIIGLQKVAVRSRIFSELFGRKDAALQILAVYDRLAISIDASSRTMEEKGQFSLALLLFESLAAQPQVLDAFDAGQRTALLRYLDMHTSAMRLDPMVYGLMNRAIPAYICGKLLAHDPASQAILARPEVLDFLKGQFLSPDATAVEFLLSAAKTHLLTAKK